MKTIAAGLALLFPVLAMASSIDPKDKYITCNCHITPGLPWTSEKSATIERHVMHHRHKSHSEAEPSKTASAVVTPSSAKPLIHHHRKIVPAQTEIAYNLEDGYPGKDAIVPSNKLALPAGKSIYAPGELVYISGRVLDMRCVPVSDAIVDIWQTNPEGYYVKSTLGERLSPAPAFAGSGRATTDNLGRFNFVTVFPGPLAARAPFIHVHVIHKDFPTLDTEMFFANDKRNGGDPVYSTLAPLQRSMVTAKVWQRDVNNPAEGLGASWDISLNGRNPYRHY